MLRPGQLLYTAARATFAINNVAGSRHGGKDEAESGVFKVDFTSVNTYSIIQHWNSKIHKIFLCGLFHSHFIKENVHSVITVENLP